MSIHPSLNTNFITTIVKYNCTVLAWIIALHKEYSN